MKRSAFVKILVGLLAIAMLLTACSGNSSSSASGSGSGSDSGSGGDSNEAVTLEWYTSIDQDQPGEADVIAAVDEYVQEQLNTTLNIHFYAAADYNQAVSTMVSAGTYMDIVFTGAGLVDFNSYAARNAFTAIEDYIDEYLPKTKEQLPQGAWDGFTYDGHIYAVPPNKDLAARWGWLANQTMIDDLGVPFPDTFDTAADLIDWFYDVKEARDAKYPDRAANPIVGGGTANRLDQWYYFEGLVGTSEYPIVAANVPGLTGFEGMGEGETAFCPFYTDEYREMVKVIRQLVVDGVIPFDAENFDPDKVLFNNGELLGQYPQGYIYVDPDMYAPYFTTVHYPAEHSLMTTAYVQSGAQAIAATSENVERSLEFLELLNNDTYLATTIRFGVEGEGWTDEDNDGVFEDGPKNADTNNRNWYNWYGWRFGSIVVSKYPQGYPENFGELVQELNDNSNQDTNLGFIFDPTNVENEIAACNNVIDQYYKTLQKGQTDDIDAQVDAFIADLKANGSDTIVEEAQNQLTAWRESVGKTVKE